MISQSVGSAHSTGTAVMDRNYILPSAVRFQDKPSAPFVVMLKCGSCWYADKPEDTYYENDYKLTLDSC